MKHAKEIIKYYAKGAELNRLNTGSSALEKFRTQAIVSRNLKRRKLRIIDIGGAHGVYSFWLAGKGHEVHLVDLSPLHIRHAKKEALKLRRKPAAMLVGNAMKLPYKDSSFDAALLLGPMYHLTRNAERLKALKEARRVLKKGGVVFVAAITRNASLFSGFFADQKMLKDSRFRNIIKRDLKDGQHRNRTKRDYFTAAYFHTPEGLEKEMKAAGLKKAGVLPVESFGGIMPGFDGVWRNRTNRKMLLESIETVETDKTITGMSPHILGIAKK